MTSSPAQGVGRREGGPERRFAEGRALPYGLMTLTVAVFAIGFYPGHMSADSLYMIDQASGALAITDHHTPILVWIWSLGWPIGLRPGAILILQVAATLAGAYLLARAAFSRLGAALVALGVAFAPAVFGNLGVVARDAWFLALLLLAGGLIVLAQRSRGRARSLALTGALLAAFLCLASRQNALAVVAILLVALVAVAFEPQLRFRRTLVRRGFPLLIGVALGVFMVVFQQIAVRAGGVERVQPEQYLYLYDLAGLSVRDGESNFPDDVYPSERIGPINRTSSLDTIIPLAFGEGAPIPMPRSAEQVAEMRQAWTDQISGDPLQYLDWRIDAFGRQIGLDAPGVFVYHPVIDPNQRGYEIEFPWANEIATGYQELFADSNNDGQVLHRAWMYLLLALAAMLVLLRTPGPARTVGALALGAWTYQAGLFFGTMGTQWRFEFPVAAIAIVAVAVAIRTLLDRRRSAAAEAVAGSPRIEPAPEPAAAARAPALSGASVEPPPSR